MNAREMFEELGYELVKLDNKILYKMKGYRIEFDLQFKEYTVYAYDDEYPSLQDVASICAKEHKAINQQCKELGWL